MRSLAPAARWTPGPARAEPALGSRTAPWPQGRSLQIAPVRPAGTTRVLVAACIGTLVLSGPAGASVRPPNPCLNPIGQAELLCPDLIMKRPFGLYLDRQVKRGRVMLRAGNSIDNVGLGPTELHGVRTGRYFMRARQRIYKRAGGRLGITTGARLFFKFVPGQLRYWKYHRAAAFELWRLDSLGRRARLVRRGPKVSYCLRDLSHSRGRLRGSPPRRVYPACNTNPRQRKVTIGTSVGWSDVYPPSYPEQWIDVTGLRGCFAYRHVADPGNGIYESDEGNNSAAVIVRLPYRAGRQRCPGARSIDPPRAREDPNDYGY